MKKYFSNDKALATSVSIVVLLFTSLFLSSLLISYFVTQMYGEHFNGISKPYNSDSFSSVQNFQSCNTTEAILDTTWSANWACQNNVGMVLTSPALTLTSYLRIEKIQKDANGIITNTYYINNSVKNVFGLHPDYGIIIRNTGGGDDLRLWVQGNGFEIPHYIGPTMVYVGPLAHFDYPNANQVTNPVITTKFNEEQNTVTFTFNGNSYTVNNLPNDGNILGLFSRFYGGVISEERGFTLTKFESANVIGSTPDIIAAAANLIYTMFKVIAWQIPPKYIPLDLQMLLIGTQEAALFIAAVAAFGRGV